MTTEKDANGKFCPLTFNSTETSNCAGSHCMAWRWVDPSKSEVVRHFVRWTADNMTVEAALATIPAGWRLAEGEVGRVKLWKDPASSFLIEREWTEAREGFCGLCEPRITEVTQ